MQPDVEISASTRGRDVVRETCAGRTSDTRTDTHRTSESRKLMSAHDDHLYLLMLYQPIECYIPPTEECT